MAIASRECCMATYKHAAASRLQPFRGRTSAVRAVASAPPPPLHIVGISGSLRKASSNTGLLRAAAQQLPAGVTFEIVPLDGLPIFNEDLYQGGTDESVLPEAVRSFRAKVLKADALLFACPEYNHGMTSPLKAAIDWGFSGRGANVFDGKAAAIVGAGGGAGTVRAQTQLRQCGVGINLRFLNGPEVALKRFENPGFFNAEGDVVDPTVAGWVGKMVASLADWARRIKA